MYAGISLKKKGPIRNDIQFGLTMQVCTTNMMSTQDHTDDLTILMLYSYEV